MCAVKLQFQSTFVYGIHFLCATTRKLLYFVDTVNYSYTGLGYTGIRTYQNPENFSPAQKQLTVYVLLAGKEPGKETDEEGTNLSVLRQALTGNLNNGAKNKLQNSGTVGAGKPGNGDTNNRGKTTANENVANETAANKKAEEVAVADFEALKKPTIFGLKFFKGPHVFSGRFSCSSFNIGAFQYPPGNFALSVPFFLPRETRNSLYIDKFRAISCLLNNPFGSVFTSL